MSAGEFILRSVVLAVALLALMRVVGKRLVGEVSAVDLVVAITVGTIAGSTSISAKVPLWGGLLALLVWGVFEWVSAYFAAHNKVFEKLVAGKETVLVEEGKISRAGLRAAMLSESAVRSLLRVHKIKDPEEVRKATLEPSGKLGIVPRRQPEPS